MIAIESMTESIWRYDSGQAELTTRMSNANERVDGSENPLTF